MNNTGHALTTNDIEAIRKAQQEWRLQKRRELEAKARKKQFRLSAAVAAQSHQKFPHSQHPPPLSDPSVIANPRLTAQTVYARQLTSGPPPVPTHHHNPALYAPPTSTQVPVPPNSQDSVTNQVLRQNAIQQHSQLQQIQQARQGVLSQQVRIQPLFQTATEHTQSPVTASAAVITTSPGVSIQPQPPTQHPSARPVAPRPSVPNHINMKNAVAAAAAAANAASAAAVAMRAQMDGKAATAKATEEAVAAAAAAAHAAANASSGHPHFAAMLPANPVTVSAAKSTQEAVDAAAAAAAAAASAAIAGSSVHISSPLDQAARMKLEELEAQRRWREEKRREIALKRAKGAGSKRGRKRTKFIQVSPTMQEQVGNQSVTAAAAGAAGITPPSSLSGLGGPSGPFSTSAGSSVAIAGTQPLAMSSGMQSQMTAVQLGVQGEFLAGGQSSECNLHSGSTGMPTAPAAIVNEGHLTAEDAAAMYAQIAGTGTGTGGASLPMDTSGTTALPLSSSGGALVDVDVMQSGEERDQGVQDVEMTGAHATAADAAEETAVEAVAQGDTAENEITKATEAAVLAAAGGCEDTDTHATQDKTIVDVEHAPEGGEGIEATGAEGGDGAGQEPVGGAGDASEPEQELVGREQQHSSRLQEQRKDVTDTAQVDMSVNVEVSEIAAEDEDVKQKENGNDGTGDHPSGINEAVDEDPHGGAEAGEAHANEETEVGHDSGGGTEVKEDDEGAQDRFQEDGGEDIMTAAAWQSLDSINP